eukprot:Rhum_TRINITY_DN14770_c6_g1::Rhum_TRINITY_DN14770_c6_g1_i1::g.115723::m.115723
MAAAPELEAPVSYLVEGCTDWQRAVWEVTGSVLAVVEDGAPPSCRRSGRRPRRCLVPLATLSEAAAANVRHLRPPEARSCGLRVTVAPGRVVYASVASSRVRDAFIHAFGCVAAADAAAGSADADIPALPKCFCGPSGGGGVSSGRGGVSRATTLTVWHDSLPSTASRSPPRPLLSMLPATSVSASPALVSTRHPQRPPPPSPSESSLSLSPPTSAGVRDAADAGDAPPPPPPARYYNVVLLYSCEAAAVAAAYAVATATSVLRDNRPRRSTFVLEYGNLVHGSGDASPRRTAAAAAAAAAASSASAAAPDDVCLPTLADLSAALSISVDAMLDLAEERRRRRLPPPPAEEPAVPSADDAEGGADSNTAADVGGGVSGLETEAISEAEEEVEEEEGGAEHEACGAKAEEEEQEEPAESVGVVCSGGSAESFSSAAVAAAAAAAVAPQSVDAEEAAGDEALARSQEVADMDAEQDSVWQGLLAPPQAPRQPPPPPPPPPPPAVQVAASPAQTTPLNGCGVDGCTQTVEEAAVQTAAQPLLVTASSSMASSLASASVGDALGAAASGLSRLSSTSAPWNEEPLPFWWTLGDGLSAGEAKGRRELTRDDEHRMLRLREQRASGVALPPEQVRELEELEVVNQRFIDAGLREMRLRYPPPPKKPRDKKEAEEARRKEREKEKAARETEREERKRAKQENALALGLPPPEDKSAIGKASSKMSKLFGKKKAAPLPTLDVQKQLVRDLNKKTKIDMLRCQEVLRSVGFDPEQAENKLKGCQ